MTITTLLFVGIYLLVSILLINNWEKPMHLIASSRQHRVKY